MNVPYSPANSCSTSYQGNEGRDVIAGTNAPLTNRKERFDRRATSCSPIKLQPRQMAERFRIIRQTFGDVINVDVGTSWNESSISFIPESPHLVFPPWKTFPSRFIDRTRLRSNFSACTTPRSACSLWWILVKWNRGQPSVHKYWGRVDRTKELYCL